MNNKHLDKIKEELALCKTSSEVNNLRQKYFKTPDGIFTLELKQFFEKEVDKYVSLSWAFLEEILQEIKQANLILKDQYKLFKDQEKDKDKEVYQQKQTIEPLLERIIEYGNAIIAKTPKSEINQITNLMPKHVLTVFFVDYLRTEVNNGGYSQFIFNSRNLYNSLVSSALEQIKANNFIEIHQKVVDFIQAHPKETEDFLKSKYFGEEIPFRSEIDATAKTRLGNEGASYFSLKPNLWDYLYKYLSENKVILEQEMNSK